MIRIDYFEKLMENMLQCKTCVNDGFAVSKEVTLTQDKKEDKEHGKPKKIRRFGIPSIVGRIVNTKSYSYRG